MKTIILIENKLRLSELKKIGLANQYTTQIIMTVNEHPANKEWFLSNKHNYALPKNDCETLTQKQD